jgi:hypothetical protein
MPHIRIFSRPTSSREIGEGYDPATEATLTGTIDEVKNLTAGGRGAGGIHLALGTASGPIEVHVGPAWFLSSKNVTFAEGETLTVVGSRMTMGGRAIMIAREIRKGDQVLTLRDASGFPLWSARNRTQ